MVHDTHEGQNVNTKKLNEWKDIPNAFSMIMHPSLALLLICCRYKSTADKTINSKYTALHIVINSISDRVNQDFCTLRHVCEI
jgi:hypothetical protein